MEVKREGLGDGQDKLNGRGNAMHTIIVRGKGFAAAHSDAIERENEPLHGHNYSVEVEIAGKLKEGMVVDFREVKKALNEVCAELDHRVILGKKDVQGEKAGKLICGEYVIPKKHAVVLPFERATCERLAEYFFARLKGKIKGLKKARVWEYEGAGAEYSA